MNHYSNPLNEIKKIFINKSSLSQLILINIIVWLIIRIISVILFLFNNEGGIQHLIIWLGVPANLDLLITRPWTLFTYMFLHYDFWHILFNMLWLFWFGKIFLEYLSSKQLVSTYILGGLAGAILYVISYNIFPVYRDVFPNSVALGASASVMAIIVAIAFYVPNYTIHLMFIGLIKIKYIAIVSVILDFMMIRSGNSGGHIAHLGGALWGLYFIYLLKKGKDINRYFYGFNFKKIFKPFFKTKKSKFTNVHYNYNNKRPDSDENYNYKKVE